ncbi:kinesin-like protein KIF13A [Apis florea]|uniref:kinesin-like protein KIF13A n=1 Tax=Apis florea TaxID=7463 RepID=UPI0012FF1407|nr:kinesin-like protein KIF13A [Apis florea]
MATDKIKVAVRVRPFNRRELELGTQCVVEMSGQQTILQHPTTMDKIERMVQLLYNEKWMERVLDQVFSSEKNH